MQIVQKELLILPPMDLSKFKRSWEWQYGTKIADDVVEAGTRHVAKIGWHLDYPLPAQDLWVCHRAALKPGTPKVPYHLFLKDTTAAGTPGTSSYIRQGGLRHIHHVTLQIY